MTCMKRSVLAAVALALASWTQAAGLFLPVTPQSAPGWVAVAGQGTTASSPVGEMSERRVRIARNELAKARDDVENSGAGRLLLNMRTDVDLDMVVERTAPTKWGYSLSGRIEGGATGFVTLVVHEQAVAGTIWTPDAAYEVVHLGGGVHALRDVTNRPPAECGGLSSEPATNETAQSGVDDGSIVDVLVVWTPAWEERAGSETQMRSNIDIAVAFTNDALERSGALVALNLVGAERVDYEEAPGGSGLEGLSTDLGRLMDPADGHMDRVHALRDTLGADLVSLISGDGGGVASGAFSVATSAAVFAHEIGHNFGLWHDRAETGLGPASFQHGSVAPRSSSYCWVTIMSYGDRCYLSGRGQPGGTIPFYSSPWRYFADGTALGVSRLSNGRGPDGPADAVLQLNRWRHRVANFRPSRSRRD